MRKNKTICRRGLALLLSLVMCLGMLPGTAWAADADTWDGTRATAFAGGSGTEKDPYRIETGAQLAYLADYVNEGYATSGKFFQLVADINLNNKPWTPIGTENYSFQGTFAGGEHTISKLKVSNTTAAGLFGYVSEAKVCDFTISAASVTSNTAPGYAGTFAGVAQGSVLCNLHAVNSNVSASNSSTSGGYTTAGGIVGAGAATASAPLLICSSSNVAPTYTGKNNSAGTVKTSAQQSAAGGIYGGPYGTSTGDVRIERCWSKVNVRGVYGTAGGIAGCDTQSHNSSVGSRLLISDCYSSSAVNVSRVSVTNYPVSAGGIVGRLCNSGSSVSRAYSNINGSDYYEGYVGAPGNGGAPMKVSFAGGIVGYVAQSGTKFTQCYNLGRVYTSNTYLQESSQKPNLGYIAGINNGTYTDCYYWNNTNVLPTDSRYVKVTVKAAAVSNDAAARQKMEADAGFQNGAWAFEEGKVTLPTLNRCEEHAIVVPDEPSFDDIDQSQYDLVMNHHLYMPAGYTTTMSLYMVDFMNGVYTANLSNNQTVFGDCGVAKIPEGGNTITDRKSRTPAFPETYGNDSNLITIESNAEANVGDTGKLAVSYNALMGDAISAQEFNCLAIITVHITEVQPLNIPKGATKTVGSFPSTAGYLRDSCYDDEGSGVGDLKIVTGAVRNSQDPVVMDLTAVGNVGQSTPVQFHHHVFYRENRMGVNAYVDELYYYLDVYDVTITDGSSDTDDPKPNVTHHVYMPAGTSTTLESYVTHPLGGSNSVKDEKILSNGDASVATVGMLSVRNYSGTNADNGQVLQIPITSAENAKKDDETSILVQQKWFGGDYTCIEKIVVHIIDPREFPLENGASDTVRALGSAERGTFEIVKAAVSSDSNIVAVNNSDENGYTATRKDSGAAAAKYEYRYVTNVATPERNQYNFRQQIVYVDVTNFAWTEEAPKLTDITKEQIDRIPDDVTNAVKDLNLSEEKDGKYVITGGTVTLLYKITVTGEPGANYVVTDKDAAWVGGEGAQPGDKGTAITGTIGENKTTAVIYVTRTFAVTTEDTVENQAFLKPGEDTELKPVEGKEPDEDGSLPSNKPSTPVTPGTGSGDDSDPEYSIAVKKEIATPDGGVEAGSTVTYTVTVTNTSDAPLYDLEITDTMDAFYAADGSMPAGLTLEKVISQTVEKNGDNTGIESVGSGEFNLGVPQRDEHGILLRDKDGNVLRDKTSEGRVNVYTWQLPGEFKKDAVVTLVYTATVTNDTSGAVELLNIADATAYTTPDESSESGEPEQQDDSARLSLRLAPIARGRVSVGGSSGINNGTGSVGGSSSNGTTTGPVQPKKFTVTYKNSGEDVNPIRTDSVTNGTNHTVLSGTIATAPENKVFGGWSGSDGKTYQPGEEVKITGNLTLTAIWNEKPADAVDYKLTFNPNGGTAGKTTELTGSSNTGSYTFTIPSAATPSKDGFVFKSWNTAEDGSGTSYAVGGEITLSTPTEVTLYAQWAENVTPPEEYTYTLTCYDGTVETDVQTYKTTAKEHSFVIPTVSRSGYELLGWSETDGGEVEYKAGERITLKSDAPEAGLYAVWKELGTDPEISDEEILGLGIKVKVVCNANKTHAETIREEYDLREGTFEPVMGRDGKSCMLRIIPDAYITQFNEDHGTHSYDETSVQGFVELVYVESEPDIGTQSDDQMLPNEQDGDSAPDGEEMPPAQEPDEPNNEPNDELNNEPSDTPDGDITNDTQIPDNTNSSTEPPANEGEDAGTDEDGEPVEFFALALAGEEESAGSWQLMDGESGVVTFSVYCEKQEPDEPETEEVTVTWLSGYGANAPIRTEMIVKGSDYSDLYPADPTRDGYRFTGWSAPVDNGDGNITITARWEALPDESRTVTVTWQNWNGDLLARENWNQDDPEPSYPGRRPTRPDSSRYTYTFDGWDREVDDDGNVTYTARFDRERIDDDDIGGGGSGTGGGTGGGTTTTPPATNIPDADVPQGDTTNITDDQTPLAGAIGLNNTEHFAYMIGYDNGTVGPMNQITRAEVATIFFRLMDDSFRSQYWSTVSGFSDVTAGKWFNNAVSTATNAGKLTGYPDGTFRPNQSITRAEFAAIAVRFLSDEVQGVSGGNFSDTAGHWAADAIGRAAAAGWIAGYPDGTFRPNAPITRAEAATIINNMLGRAPDKEHLLDDMIVWPDNPETAWYYEAIQEATNSHDYERDELGVTEIWSAIQTVRDWKALEEQWAA